LAGRTSFTLVGSAFSVRFQVLGSGAALRAPNREPRSMNAEHERRTEPEHELRTENTEA